MEEFFNVSHLCYSYIKKPLCLKDISFSAKNNEKILICGVKDSGKSTFIKTLSGFDEKYFGSIKISGQELKSISDEEKQVSLILDYPTLLNVKIEKNIDYVYKVLDKEFISKEEKISLLNKFNLGYDLNAKISKLTKFEQFKLCFLRTFIKNPRIIFIDDIMKNEFSEEEVEELKSILSFVCENKLTFLCVSDKSYLNNKSFYDWFGADKILYLNLATVTEYKTISGLLSNPADLDACNFNDGLNHKEGYCVKQNGRYYLSVEETFVVKTDSKLDSCFDKLKLADNENEDVEIVFDNQLEVDFSKNNDINKQLIERNIKIFSKLDRSRVI